MSENTMNGTGNEGGSVTVGLPEMVERVAKAMADADASHSAWKLYV